MRHQDMHDVVIVGARPAGAATALILARNGHRVLVVDRAAPGSDTLSTHALMRGGVLQLHRLGLLGAVVEAGTPAIHRATFDYGDEQIVVALKPSPGVDALYAPRRTVLDPIIVDAAERAGAEFQFGTTLTGLLRATDGRVVGINARNQEGDAFDIRARITIGADGMRSLVARTVEAPTTVVGQNTSAVVYGYWEGIDADGYEWMYRPGLSGGLIPTNGGVLVWVGMPPGPFRSEIRPAVAEGFGKVLRRLSPELASRVAAGRSVGRLRTFPGSPGYLRRPWGPGWALVGDSGYFKDPITVHGITDALRDAELLAGAVTATLVDGDPTALAGYEQTRDALSRQLFTVTEAVAAYDWTMDEVKGLLLESSNAMREEMEFLSALPDAHTLAA